MADFDEPLPSVAFPHELDSLLLRTGDTDPYEIIVRVGGQNGTDILNTTLYPDTDGIVVLSDLAELLRENLPDVNATEVCFGLDDHSESVLVIPGRADILDTASDFTQSHFLTLLDGAKPTYIGAIEYLTFFVAQQGGDATPSPVIICLWVNPDTGLTLETAGRRRTLTNYGSGLYTICLLPEDFEAPDDGYILHSF